MSMMNLKFAGPKHPTATDYLQKQNGNLQPEQTENMCFPEEMTQSWLVGSKKIQKNIANQ